MRTALFAWELGLGTGHVARLRRLGKRLAHHGLRLIAAVRTPAVAQVLVDDGIEVLQAPRWPAASLSERERAALPSATLGDTLAGGGFGHEETLRAVLAQWDRIVRQVDPDLVVADYAPAAALAVRGRIPLIWVGNGFTLPPATLPRFPALHDVSPPAWREEEIVEVVNRAALASGLQPIERLAQLFDGDGRCVQTFALLDPYRAVRVEAPDGPILDRLPAARRPDARTIFMYIAKGNPVRMDIVAPLKPLARNLRIFAPGLPAQAVTSLASAGAIVEKAPLSLVDVFPDTRLLIHIAGHGVACEALIAGVPQLVLSVDIEKELYGRALEEAGVGRMVKAHYQEATLSTDVIATLAADERMAARAAELGEQHREYVQRADPVSRFEKMALALLGQRPA
jgi:hypothetical protein